jgi:hypothetical protein
MNKSPWIAAATALLVVGGTASAHAAPSRWETNTATGNFSFDDCGFEITGVFTFTERLKWRQPREAGAPPLLFQVYQAHQEFTANGVTLTLDGQALYKDRRATLVEGTVWEFVVSDLGLPYTLRDASGRVLVRDRGVITRSFRVDTLGDADPGNDVFVEDGSVLADKGEHPGFYLDFCEDIAPYFNA